MSTPQSPADTAQTTGDSLERTPVAQLAHDAAVNGAAMDPFNDDTPLACGVENPDQCDSCT